MGAFLGSVLIAGCYVSQSRQSLYIEQLFVRKDVQYHPDLHVGTALIKYVLQHKEEIESFFHASFHDAYHAMGCKSGSDEYPSYCG